MEDIKLIKIVSSSTKNVIGVVINGTPYIETKEEPFKKILPKLIQKYGIEFETKFHSKNTKTIIKETPYNIITITDKNYKKILGVIINGKPYIETKYQSFKELFPKILSAYGKQFEEEYYSENNKCITIEEYNKQLTKKIQNKIKKETNTTITNIKPYQKNINICREDVISGKQITLTHAEYQLGEMNATQDIGRNRTGQEDSVIILEHPKNKDFKLIAVADGVGGSSLGEIASNTTLTNLTHWFESLDPNTYQDIIPLQKDIQKLLQNILKQAPIPNDSSTTLSAVIIGKNQTLITNLGDSRVYTTKNKVINQETKDDSYVQQLFDHKRISTQELMRFHKHSNRITNGISKQGTIDKPNFKIIPNESYDRIIATSDGASDLISEKELETIINKSKPQEISQNIVNHAINNTSTLQSTINNLPQREKVKAIQELNQASQFYQKTIQKGKDNTSVVAFAKK